jgi:tetratricopeptide (TPR) repeat protein
VRTVVVVALLAASGLAAAQPAAPPQPTPADPPPAEAPAERTPAEQLFEEGRLLLDEGKPGEACAKFEASIKLSPDAPGTLLNLGLCNMRLAKTATALYWFRKAQFRAAETGMTDYDVGGFRINLRAGVRDSVRAIDLVSITPDGKIVR